jgi:sugar-specific transcriptional regulator TrmB
MTEEPRAEALLKHLGLTEYEAKAFLTLITQRSLTAEKISAKSGIPLPRVYDTMNSLSEKGFVMVSKTRPQTFRVIDPSQLSRILKEEEQKRMEDKIKKIETIMPEFLDSVSSLQIISTEEKDAEETIEYAKKKINMEALWIDLHSKATNEFLVFTGDMSWMIKTLDILKKSLKKGVDYKVVWSKKTKEAKQNAKKLEKLGVETRFNNEVGDLRGFVIDGNFVSLLRMTPKTGFRIENVREVDPEAERFANFTTILISEKAIAHVFKRYFMYLWKNAISSEKVKVQ